MGMLLLRRGPMVLIGGRGRRLRLVAMLLLLLLRGVGLLLRGRGWRVGHPRGSCSPVGPGGPRPTRGGRGVAGAWACSLVGWRGPLGRAPLLPLLLLLGRVAEGCPLQPRLGRRPAV
jgi:hypothetical protein